MTRNEKAMARKIFDEIGQEVFDLYVTICTNSVEFKKNYRYHEPDEEDLEGTAKFYLSHAYNWNNCPFKGGLWWDSQLFTKEESDAISAMLMDAISDSLNHHNRLN